MYPLTVYPHRPTIPYPPHEGKLPAGRRRLLCVPQRRESNDSPHVANNRHWRNRMFAGIRKIISITAIVTVLGALVGVLIGGLTGQYLLWVGVMAAVGAAVGVTLAYGFLPER